MTRISVTVPMELLNKFDKVLKENGYNSRTKGLQDAMKEFINQHRYSL